VERDSGPCFDRPVGPKGYAWWYVDALSDDGAYGLTIIAFVGSVFSPYYAWSGRRNPLDHCAINVALYGPRDKRWAMTERGRSAVAREANRLAIGRSGFVWDGSGLKIFIDEVCVPIPLRIQGTVRLEAGGLNSRHFHLDACGLHVWRPIAPAARVTVDLSCPALSWSGDGYFDMNAGAEPLEKGFESWTWLRATLARGAAILYDAKRRDGEALSLAMRFDKWGRYEPMEPPPVVKLPRTRWLLPRKTRSDDCIATASRTFEDTPFYARSLVSATLFGTHVTAMHESLSLTRVSNPIVRLMLPFRMPRSSFLR
jgi:carotenoid 1,2-hydratase